MKMSCVFEKYHDCRDHIIGLSQSCRWLHHTFCCCWGMPLLTTFAQPSQYFAFGFLVQETAPHHCHWNTAAVYMLCWRGGRCFPSPKKIRSIGLCLSGICVQQMVGGLNANNSYVWNDNLDFICDVCLLITVLFVGMCAVNWHIRL